MLSSTTEINIAKYENIGKWLNGNTHISTYFSVTIAYDIMIAYLLTGLMYDIFPLVVKCFDMNQ